jgi:hypothetical protein
VVPEAAAPVHVVAVEPVERMEQMTLLATPTRMRTIRPLRASVAAEADAVVRDRTLI